MGPGIPLTCSEVLKGLLECGCCDTNTTSKSGIVWNIYVGLWDESSLLLVQEDGLDTDTFMRWIYL